MPWTSLEDENGYRRLQVEAPWPELAADYGDLVAQYARLPLPGFRVGKAPRGVVEQRFRAAILEDLANRTAQRLGREALREAGVEALGSVEAAEVACEKDRPFRAVVRYLPMPEFRLPPLAGLAGVDDGTDPRDRISRRLLELAPFEVPGDLVRRELLADGVEESPAGSEAWGAAAERIRLLVILKRIAREEGIGVDDRDVERRIEEKAQDFGTTRKALQAELEKGGGTVRLRDMLLAERTLEYLMEFRQP